MKKIGCDVCDLWFFIITPRFHDFHSPPLDEADFDAKPMILLVGQYSTGKTTFIKYLLEQEFPGMRIGPEPTTDCFIIITKVSAPSKGFVVI